jgi:arylsulfatase A-like enzyme
LKPNIIFILLDGSRWDRVNHSPEFNELIHEGTFLNNVTAAIPYTIGSVNALFTGKYGKDNGIDAYYKMFRLKDSVKVLPEILQTQGYFTACDLLSEKIISKRGYDIHQFHDEYKDNLSVRHPKFIKDCLQKANDKPLFLFLHFTRIHTVTVSEILKKYEWNNQEFYDKKDDNLLNYDKTFLEAGNYAKLIKKTIVDLGILNDTILIFFSDHGTGVGERYGERNYGSFTYEETIRAFFLFMGKDIVKNRISEKLRENIDIFPTILNLTNVKTEFDGTGESFSEYLKNPNKDLDDKKYAYSETGALQGPFPSPMKPNVFCIKTVEHKLIYLKTPEEWRLYNLKNDPNEIHNIYNENKSVSEELKKKLLEWINR